MPLEDELYKSLLEESKLYREKVSAIWLQKFTLLGGVIAFAVAHHKIASSAEQYVLIAAIVALPVTAVLLESNSASLEFTERNRPLPEATFQRAGGPRGVGIHKIGETASISQTAG